MQIPLCGHESIIGRAVVVHGDPDDLGKGNFSNHLLLDSSLSFYKQYISGLYLPYSNPKEKYYQLARLYNREVTVFGIFCSENLPCFAFFLYIYNAYERACRKVVWLEQLCNRVQMIKWGNQNTQNIKDDWLVDDY